MIILGKLVDPNLAKADPIALLKPYDLAQFIKPEALTGDLVHRFYMNQLQIDGGRNDKFMALSDNGGLVMSYFDASDLPEGALARQYSLFDHFFQGAFGGSFLNRQFLIAAAAPVFPKAPAGMIASTLVPSQSNPTIGDRMSEKGLGWAWYSGGWTYALAGLPDPLFQYHHQPFVCLRNLSDGSAAKAEHPGYASLARGQRHVADLVRLVQESPPWQDTAIIITYDEFGGRWDHMAPPVIDRWGPGPRVPTILVSPYAKKGYAEHGVFETTAILKLIENRWELLPLNSRDAGAGDMLGAFEF